MSRLTLQEYLNERIKNVEYYIEFNERKDDKDFFAHKELELYQMAQKYMQLSNELGCPLDVVFKAIKYGIDGYLQLILEYDEKDGWYFDAIWKYNDFGDYGNILYLKDYKKTWFLKEDLSE